jgi:hypothetical protein
VPVSGIPYSDSFGVPSVPKTLATVANATSAVDYAFTTPGADFASKVAHDAPPPDWLEALLFSFNNPPASFETQFFLGPAGSGAPVHYHGHGEEKETGGGGAWELGAQTFSIY